MGILWIFYGYPVVRVLDAPCSGYHLVVEECKVAGKNIAGRGRKEGWKEGSEREKKRKKSRAGLRI